MAGIAAGHQLDPERRLLTDAHLHDLATVGQDVDVVALVDAVFAVGHHVGPVLYEPASAGLAARLLVGRGEQDQVAVEGLAAALDGDHRHQLDGADALAVERATSVHEAAFTRPGERRHPPGPRVGGHHVEMGQQDDGPPGAAPRQPSVQIPPPGGRLDHLGGDAFGGEPAGEGIGRGGLAARWIGRVDAEHVGQQLCRLVAELPPVELGCLRR